MHPHNCKKTAIKQISGLWLIFWYHYLAVTVYYLAFTNRN